MPNLESNIGKVYALKFFLTFLLLMPVIIPFFNSLGLNMEQVFILLSVFSGSCFLFEVPSGYISDLLGRKKTLVLSSILRGVGFTFFAFEPDFNTLVVAEVILGISVSLYSGTDTSLIYDTLSALNSKKAQIKILGKSIFYLTLGEAIASVIATILMLCSFDIQDLAISSAVLSWIPVFISITLVEPPREVMTESHKDNFSMIFSKLFRESRFLKLILLNIVFYFSVTMIGIWSFQKYWESLHIPVIYFGLLWGATNFTAAIVGKYAHKVEKKWGSTNILIFIGMLPIISFLGISLTDHVVGFIFCLSFQICRGLGQVILKDALNTRVTGDFRATANSIAQMGTRIFFVIISPIFGYLIDTETLSRATLYMGILYILVFIGVMLPILKEKIHFKEI